MGGGGRCGGNCGGGGSDGGGGRCGGGDAIGKALAQISKPPNTTEPSERHSILSPAFMSTLLGPAPEPPRYRVPLMVAKS